MSESIELEKAFAFEVYPKRELVVVRGEGATLWDDQGKRVHRLYGRNRGG